MLPPLHIRHFSLLLVFNFLVSGQAHSEEFEVFVGPGFRFNPSNLSIQQGDTVTWTWRGGVHTVTSGTGPTDPLAGVDFDSGFLAGFNTFSHTFDATGSFNYYCAPHISFGMTGVVNVTESDSDGDGVPDSMDNCVSLPNSGTLGCDSDLDGYGNACDGDFNNDFATEWADFNRFFLSDFIAGVMSTHEDGVPTGTDMNCDGVVDGADFNPSFINQFLSGSPGPSAAP